MNQVRRAELREAMTRLADGDRDAFPIVYRHVGPLVDRLAHRLLNDPADAEEAAQAGLMRIFERASDYDPRRDPVPWMLTLAAWECRTIRQRRRRSREDGLGVEPVDHVECPESQVVKTQLADVLHEVMGTLRADDLGALTAAYLDGPRPEISPAAFRKRVQRALQRLRLAWEGHHG